MGLQASMNRVKSFFSKPKCGDLDYNKIDLIKGREDIDPETKNYIEMRVIKKIIFFDCLKDKEKTSWLHISVDTNPGSNGFNKIPAPQSVFSVAL